MGAIIGLILFGIPSVIIAGSKGFSPFRWLIAFGLIGLIVVISLPSAKTDSITAEESETRKNRADNIGGWMTGINLGLGVVIFIITLSTL
jgi:hypothetical protein